METIKTLFPRKFENHNIIEISPTPPDELRCILQGKGIATVKYDGSCCAVINGIFYKRYDAKHGKKIPDNAIKCQEKPDNVTGHLPCWIPCDKNDNSNKWFWKAFDLYIAEHGSIPDGTYECIGKHFRNNPYKLDNDILVPHGQNIIEVPRTFEGIRDYLKNHQIEGIVFWKDGKPLCKIKRSDFGFEWNRNTPKHS